MTQDEAAVAISQNEGGKFGITKKVPSLKKQCSLGKLSSGWLKLYSLEHIKQILQENSLTNKVICFGSYSKTWSNRALFEMRHCLLVSLTAC